MGESEADLAAEYDRTHDTSGFERESQEFEVRRSVTISVRFSEDEINRLRKRADEAGVKVTAYIRSAALAADQPFDRKAIARLAATVEQQAHELREAVG